MAQHTTHHATIVFERIFDAPAQRVFAALSDPVARARWSAPSDTAVLIYDEADFRVGGRDIFRCGAKNDPRYRGETHYRNIVPNRRIVSTETVQLAALGDPRMIDGTKEGYTGALDNLARFLERP